MKKVLSILLTAVLSMSTLLCCGTALAATYTIDMDVKFDENLLFSTYDVDVYLDSSLIGTYKHGRDFSSSFIADEGNHTIWFYEHNDKSNSGSIPISISSDTTVKCRIHCRSSKVEVSEVEIDRAAAPARSLPEASAEEPPETTDETAENNSISSEVEKVQSVAPSATGNGVWISFDTATDEELEEALNKIKAEQRARIKTKIVLSKNTLTLGKGKTEQIEFSITDLPEGVTAGKITAVTADKTIATIQNKQIKGVGNGNTVITYSCVLSDGTEITEECRVEVLTLVKAVQPGKKNIEMGVGESYEPEFKITPNDASDPRLSITSSDTSVVQVDSHGKLHATGIGTATITATTRDGSNLSASMTVKTSKKDDIGKTRITKDGVSVTLNKKRVTSGSGFTKAETGNVFVLAEFLFENNSGDTKNISSLGDFAAYCDGYTCDYSLTAAMNETQSLDGAVAPGKKLKGEIGYEVPSNWKELEIHIQINIWSSEELVFVIYNDK